MKDKSIQEEIHDEIFRIVVEAQTFAPRPDKHPNLVTYEILKYLDSKNVRLLDRDIEEAGVAHMQRLVEE